MDVKQLVCYLAVAEHLNFSRAAEALYISQPALSHQIADLEHELGGALFYRDRRSVRLTPLGSALLEPAQRTVDSLEQVRSMARMGPAELRDKVLRLGLDNTEDHPEYAGVSLTTANFLRTRPEVSAELHYLPFNECVERLQFDELDLAFLILRHNESLPADLERQIIARDRMVLLVREDCPAHTCAEALNLLDLGLVSDKPRGRSRILRCFTAMGITPRLHMVDSVPASFLLAQAGRLAMVFPSNYLEHTSGTGLRAIPIEGDALLREFSAVWKRGNLHPAAKELLAQFPCL